MPENPAVTPPSSAANLGLGLGFIRQLLRARLSRHLAGKFKQEPFPSVPEWQEDGSPFYVFVSERKPEFADLTAIMLPLVPEIMPNLFESEIANFLPGGGDILDMGGVKGDNFRGMIPTAETLIFLVAGTDLNNRLTSQQWIRHNSLFTSEKLVLVGKPKSGDPPMSGRLAIDSELAEWFLTGTVSIPEMSTEFPAQYLASDLSWDELILAEETSLRIQDLQSWLQYHHTLMVDWGMQRKLNPGFRVLFHGPPGTGKTLTATLLGKYSQLPVFRIDLSMVVSKYIGETEKNLSSLFDKAENKNWILFFDEADSLFGKRTNVRDAHDKYANQEVSYLLQRIESYPGLVILASNFKNNIDEAFLRRFQSVVYFPLPGEKERTKLWEKAIPGAVSIASDLDLSEIGGQFELTGSNIMNIIQHASIQLLARQTTMLDKKTLLYSVQHEFMKEDRIMTKRGKLQGR